MCIQKLRRRHTTFKEKWVINLNNIDMSNFEKETIEFINTLPVEVREQLVEIIEWEKEMSWSNGYEDAVEQLENK